MAGCEELDGSHTQQCMHTASQSGVLTSHLIMFALQMRACCLQNIRHSGRQQKREDGPLECLLMLVIPL